MTLKISPFDFATPVIAVLDCFDVKISILNIIVKYKEP